MAGTNNVLTLPKDAGRAIVEAAALICCPLLGTDRFVKFCRDRGASLDRERLLRLECLGLFAPVFRARRPADDAPPFYIPVRPGSSWFEQGWAWDTTAVPSSHLVPDFKDRSHEGYYSIFQLDYLCRVLNQLTFSVQMDGFIDLGDKIDIDWNKQGRGWLHHAEGLVEIFRSHEYRRSVGLLCQYVSNRYYPSTQGDQRTIRIHQCHYSDGWISVYAPDWSWHEEANRWEPKTAAALFDLTPEKLHHAYRGLADEQSHCDPLERWYQLVQFVDVRQRERLKGDALRADTLRAGAHMLRLLYKDLYSEELPHPNEVKGMITVHVPELAVRADTRRYLEFVANRFGVNPQPRLALIIEGQTEEASIRKIFGDYYGAHPGSYGIEFIVLGGVGTATGSKREDRFRAIFRLVDYLHHHQTFTFLILDNENYATKLKNEARELASTYGTRRYVTRADYIRIWKRSFEFDNFSCSEIAAAMTELAQARVRFAVSDVVNCTKEASPGKSLTDLYRQRTGYDLPKVRLSEMLTERMLSGQARRKPATRPIIKALDRVVRLAARNPLPVMLEIWEKNQTSKYLSKRRRPFRGRSATAPSQAPRSRH